MPRLRITHETVYRFPRPVSFGPWRLLMRPSDSHSARVVEATFDLSPPGTTRWTHDAYGNSVCHFTPEGHSDVLQVVNHLLIERYPAPLSPPCRDAPLAVFPVVYEPASAIVLAPFMAPACPHPDAAYLLWLAQVGPQPAEPALDYIIRLNTTIHTGFAYAARYAVGTQTPSQTVATGGTCRDLAWLMIETLRHAGLAARFITGYLYAREASVLGASATHAWCEVFLPDLGWIECDPTNGLIESSDLIRVAVTRTPEEASPMDGVLFDSPGGETLTVQVDVRQEGD
jgi:transglutaminase-like putative cysteine protease